ncbi:MAG: cysteine desulfurase NifS [Candidatus Aminicenantes bacterium]|nr:MAG: cysteine desulfurase NifS [Candidatus Aminicenantes bacterium]RLE05353.1 MAG: cysteine desulfurase NifS [Candidatus Aminicenantes bacterium]HHF42493.1 cysteine desulfurase [Candidatus Aminicenantes bacterium]
MKKIYFDHIAATPVAPEVRQAMEPFLGEKFGNPQSLHSFGQEVSLAIEKARSQVAALIKAEPEEIYFTSSGSESNNLAIKGLALANQKKGRHILLSAIEHQSVLYAGKFLEKLGFEVENIPVDSWGWVDPEAVRRAIKAETILVAVMMANSEVGTIQDVAEIASICAEKEVLFHTDAVAYAGSLPLDVSSFPVNTLSLAAHQFYGPKGAAALYIKKGTRLLPLIDGGIQEGGRRAGTENVAGIVGLGEAARLAAQKMKDWQQELGPLRDYLIEELPRRVEHVVLTGHPRRRLPYHASFCVRFIEGEAMLLNLDMKGIAASSGSACTSRALKASHVLLALGLDHALAQGSLVFSLITGNKPQDIDYLLEVFPPIVERLREMSPLYAKFKEGES